MLPLILRTAFAATALIAGLVAAGPGHGQMPQTPQAPVATPDKALEQAKDKAQEQAKDQAKDAAEQKLREATGAPAAPTATAPAVETPAVPGKEVIPGKDALPTPGEAPKVPGR